jgi:hypothetical protein
VEGALWVGFDVCEQHLISISSDENNSYSFRGSLASKFETDNSNAVHLVLKSIDTEIWDGQFG